MKLSLLRCWQAWVSPEFSVTRSLGVAEPRPIGDIMNIRCESVFAALDENGNVTLEFRMRGELENGDPLTFLRRVENVPIEELRRMARLLDEAETRLRGKVNDKYQ